MLALGQLTPRCPWPKVVFNRRSAPATAKPGRTSWSERLSFSCAGLAVGSRLARASAPARGHRRTQVQSLLKKSASIIGSFQWQRFSPAFYARNPHVMTILGSEVLFKFGPDALPEGLDFHRERYETPDDDFFDVDFSSAAGASAGAMTSDRPLVILLHGLESNSRSPFCCRLTRAFQSEGFDVAVLCFRSCSGEMNRTAGSYNVGFTDDLVQLCTQMRAASPSRQIFLSGFSLGGNAICKLIGERGEDVISLGIEGAAVCNVPFEPEVTSAAMDSGMGLFYSWNFLKSLKPKAQEKAEMLKARGELVPYDVDKVLRAETVGDFDDACVAPLYGFKDKLDYYRTQGCMRFLKDVRVPVLAMNAKDDPLVDATSLPTEEQVSEAVLLYYPEFGGHCGFISDESADDPRNYCPKLLASFLRHVYDSRKNFPICMSCQFGTD